MIRKKILLINIYLVAVLALTSCSKFLDDPAPDTSIGAGQITSRDIPLLVQGTYAKMLGTSYPQIYPMFDIYADDIISVQGGSATRFNPALYDANNPSPTESFSNSFYYLSNYTAIGNANFIINYIRSRKLETHNKELGEALSIRAISYLALTEAYKGVVITLGSNEDPADLKRPQNTEDEVYARILTDLLDAEKLLPSFTKSEAFSKEAVQVLLARIYLNRNDYKKAKEYAEAAIKSPATGLSDNFSSNFKFANTGNKEVLFRLVQGPMPSSYDRAGMYAMYTPGSPFRSPSGIPGNGQTWVSNEYVSLFDATDVRAKLLREQFSSSAGKVVTFLMKFCIDTLQTTNPYVTYPRIRLSEAHLIAAEADARQNNIDVTYYNELRVKRNVATKTAADFSSPAQFLTEIENERRRELIGEGLRWQDMRRFGKAIGFLESKGQTASRLIWPFPAAERTRNPKLEQNKDY